MSQAHIQKSAPSFQFMNGTTSRSTRRIMANNFRVVCVMQNLSSVGITLFILRVVLQLVCFKVTHITLYQKTGVKNSEARY